MSSKSFLFVAELQLVIAEDTAVEDELTTEVALPLLLPTLEMASGVEQWMLDDVEDAAKSWEQASCNTQKYNTRSMMSATVYCQNWPSPYKTDGLINQTTTQYTSYDFIH